MVVGIDGDLGKGVADADTLLLNRAAQAALRAIWRKEFSYQKQE
jgi:hypothetical protein